MQILTKSGFQDFDGIQCNGWREDMLKFTFDDGTVIKCTHDHKFLLDYCEEETYVQAWMLGEGNSLSGKVVVSVEESEPELVYTPINVANGHNYLIDGITNRNCDEFSFLPNSKAFWQATYPTVAKREQSKVIITSTPDGMGNEFYNQWEKAKKRLSKFLPIRWFWDKVPGYDEKFKQETIANTSEEQWRTEFECEFLSTSNTLIDGKILTRIATQEPIKTYDNANVYEHPVPDEKYVLAVDVADGVGKDYSVITCINISNKPYKVAMVFRDNKISPFSLDTLVVSWAKRYNNGFVVVETNSRGADVAHRILNDHMYENIFIKDPTKPSGLGIDMKENIKKKGCVTLKNMVETDMLEICDHDMLRELKTFQRTRTGSFAGVNGLNDDMVMTLVLFSILTTEVIFIDLQGSDKDINETVRSIRNAMLPQEMLLDAFIANSSSPFDDFGNVSNLFRHGGSDDDQYDDIQFYFNTDDY